MFYWLLQSEEAHPALARGDPPSGLLSPIETAELTKFTCEARRRDWLLGRWTAKRLLQQIAEQHCGYQVPLNSIIIATDRDGAPLTSFRQPLTGKAFSLSISHSQGYALCGVIARPETPLGVDLEWVVPHDSDFAKAFLSLTEQKLIDEAVERLVDLHVNALWSAKESVVKALRAVGRMDLRTIHCQLKPVLHEPQTWTPFSIDYPRVATPQNSSRRLTGWWQTVGGFVLTLVKPA